MIQANIPSQDHFYLPPGDQLDPRSVREGQQGQLSILLRIMDDRRSRYHVVDQAEMFDPFPDIPTGHTDMM
jgi:hypothetical protein